MIGARYGHEETPFREQTTLLGARANKNGFYRPHLSCGHVEAINRHEDDDTPSFIGDLIIEPDQTIAWQIRLLQARFCSNRRIDGTQRAVLEYRQMHMRAISCHAPQPNTNSYTTIWR